MQGLQGISTEGHRAISNVRTQGETSKETEVIEMIEEAALEREALQVAGTAMVALWMAT